MNRVIKFRAWVEEEEGRKAHMVGWDNPFMKWDLKDMQNRPVSLMQFTGLLDRKGKEIYEGDILRWEDVVAVVEWDEAAACFGEMEGHPPLDRIYYWKEAKIIGNIYENPDLLKV